jgi:4-hydroxybenzoate polyprenyltransferase
VRTFLAVLDLIRFRRPVGTFLLFMPALWGLLAAWKGRPPFFMILLFAVGAFVMRSAGCAINDILDRNVDGKVSRTRDRPLPSGRLGLMSAWAVFVVFSLVAASLLLFLHPLTRWVALAGFGATMVYPLMKRFMPLPQIFMGVPFGMTAPLMAWAEGRGTLAWPAFMIALGGLFWSTAYDLVYAIADREDDVQAGIRSGAVTFGDRLWLAILLFGLAASWFLWAAGFDLGMNRYYPWSVGIFLAFMVWQSLMVRNGISPRGALSCFKSHVWIGLIVAVGIWFESPLMV